MFRALYCFLCCFLFFVLKANLIQGSNFQEDQWVSFPVFLTLITNTPKNVSFVELTQDREVPDLLMFIEGLELSNQPLKPLKFYLGSGKFSDQGHQFSLRKMIDLLNFIYIFSQRYHSPFWGNVRQSVSHILEDLGGNPRILKCIRSQSLFGDE